MSLAFDPVGDLSGNVSFEGETAELFMGITDNIVTNAFFGSDGTVFGCSNSLCFGSGNWLFQGYTNFAFVDPPTPVPEPGTLGLFCTMAILLVGLKLEPRWRKYNGRELASI